MYKKYLLVLLILVSMAYGLNIGINDDKIPLVNISSPSNQFGLLNGDNIWTGNNTFIGNTTFNNVNVTNSSYLCLNGFCITKIDFFNQTDGNYLYNDTLGKVYFNTTKLNIYALDSKVDSINNLSNQSIRDLLLKSNNNWTGTNDFKNNVSINTNSSSAFTVSNISNTFSVNTAINYVNIFGSVSQSGSGQNLNTAYQMSPTMSMTSSDAYGIYVAPLLTNIPSTQVNFRGIRFNANLAGGDGGFSHYLTGGQFFSGITQAGKTWTAGQTHTLIGVSAEAQSNYFYGSPIPSNVMAISGYFRNPTFAGVTGNTDGYAIISEGDVQINTGYKLILEGMTLIQNKGDSYLVYDSTRKSIDAFVNSNRSVSIANENTTFWIQNKTSLLMNTTDVTVNKTLRVLGNMTLQNTVWDDVFISTTSLGSGINAPTLTSYNLTNIKIYCFAGSVHNDDASSCSEMPHNWKEGSDIEIHQHNVQDGTSTNPIVWNITYYIQQMDGSRYMNGTLGNISTSKGKWNLTYVDYPDISMTNFKLGTQICIQFTRTQDHPTDTNPDNSCPLTVGIHYQIDSLGSDTEYTK